MMTERELISLAKLYKGELIKPKKYQGDEALLWQGEKIICEGCGHLIPSDNAYSTFIGLLEAFVGKWSPWDAEEIMEKYRKI